MKETTFEQLSTLVAILAESDAIWLPCRDFRHGHRPAHCFFGRQDFPSLGVHWVSVAATEAERKTERRDLEELARQGAVVVSRIRRTKAIGVRLTGHTEDRVRQLIGLPGIRAAWHMARRLHDLTHRPARTLDHVYIPERRIASGVSLGSLQSKADRQALIDLEDTLLPALTRGYVESVSDVRRCVSYRLTPEGEGWIACDEPPFPEGGHEINEELRGDYFERLRATHGRFDSAPPSGPRELGLRPFTASPVGAPLQLA